MRIEFRISDFGFRIDPKSDGSFPPAIRNPQSAIRNRNGFTLIEVMVVMVLLSLIVLVLMAVFNSTQVAFRAGVTQSDVLESGRAAMDLMASDLKQMSPACDYSNQPAANGYSAYGVNFYANTNINEQPLVQSLVASSQQRTNVLERFFILSRQNQTWTGVGYVVANSPQGDLYSLYRFSATTNTQSAGDPAAMLFNIFNTNSVTSMSHLMDGVVALTVRAYDINGGLMNGKIVFAGGQFTTNRNVYYLPSTLGQTGFYMFSNTLPASVEIEMGALEDRTLQRADSLSGSSVAQSNYLSNAAGQVHIFRQRVSIPNVDPAAYQ
jgi:prepilin-type N-terminal cleavage/methylation domain-containing protein